MIGKEPLEKDQYEQFVQLIVSGKKKYLAYSEAFGNKNKNSCKAAAARVFKRPEVQSRYIYLMGEAEKERKKKPVKHPHAKVTKNAVSREEKVSHAKEAVGDRARIVEAWENIAKVNIADFFEIKETKAGPELILKNIKDLPPELSVCIKSIKYDKNGNPVLELYDRMAALNKLSDYYQLIQQDSNEEQSNISFNEMKEEYTG